MISFIRNDHKNQMYRGRKESVSGYGDEGKQFEWSLGREVGYTDEGFLFDLEWGMTADDRPSFLGGKIFLKLPVVICLYNCMNILKHLIV